MKDPAFLFYSQDFLTGTLIMSFEDRGRYITLLSYQHQTGRMNEETIRLLVGSFSDTLRLKFKQDESGLFYNERLELEIEKRSRFIESRINNGKLGGRPLKNKKPSGKPKHNPPEDENRNENEILKFEFKKEFESILLIWFEYKKKRKQTYKDEKSREAFYKLLFKYSNGDLKIATEIIENSMANNWAGIFELKNNSDGKDKSNNSEGEFTNKRKFKIVGEETN